MNAIGPDKSLSQARHAHVVSSVNLHVSRRQLRVSANGGRQGAVHVRRQVGGGHARGRLSAQVQRRGRHGNLILAVNLDIAANTHRNRTARQASGLCSKHVNHTRVAHASVLSGDIDRVTRVQCRILKGRSHALTSGQRRIAERCVRRIPRSRFQAQSREQIHGIGHVDICVGGGGSQHIPHSDARALRQEVNRAFNAAGHRRGSDRESVTHGERCVAKGRQVDLARRPLRRA